MTPTAANSAAADRPRRFLRRVLTALAGILLAIHFYSPVREVAAVTLDGSNNSSYAYFTAHHFQYGTEIVPMAGPYGFLLYGWAYNGDLFWARAAGQLLLSGALAALTIWFLRRQRPVWLAVVWLAAHVSFSTFHEDLGIEWTMLLAGWFLIQDAGRSRRWVTLAVTALLALLSLIKGSQVALGLATLAVALGAHAVQRNWRHTATLAAGYGGALLGWWLLAGQNPWHLPAYLHGTFELATGYNRSMSLEEPREVLLRGVLVSATLLVALGWGLWQRRREAVVVASLLLLAGHAFVQWKHSFVRADGHAYIFFNFAVVAALTVPLLAGPAAGSAHRRLALAAGLLVLGATAALCTLGAREPGLPDVRWSLRVVRQRLGENGRQLANLPATRRHFEAVQAAQRRQYEMPLTRRAVGRASIDHFGFEHRRLPLNQLDYHPRPMGGGPFNAYTPFLTGLNQEFLRDPARRPEFYLLRLQTIDGRLLAQDDSLTLLALLQLYQPVLMEQEHVLLRAVPGAQLAAPRSLGKSVVQLGDSVPVPAVGPGEMIAVRLEVRPSLLGRLREFFYKLPRVRFARRGPGINEPDASRLVPVMAASPFLLSPVVDDTRQLLEFYAGRSTRWPREFRLSVSDRTWFQRSVTVEFYALPRPPVPAGVNFDALIHFTTSPIEVVNTLTQTGEPVTLNGQLLHAPAWLAWSLQGGERRLRFGYGLTPGAYTRPDPTDGLEFVVTLHQPGQPDRELFRRLLDPAKRTEDRGHHVADVALPAPVFGSWVEIESRPGPRENTAFDWGYVSDLQFSDDAPPAATR